MKAIILQKAGGVKNLEVVEMDKPTIKSDEVLVKVATIGINPADVKARAYEDVLGWIYEDKRPVVLGWDIAGEVVEVGEHVSRFKIGDQVFGMVRFFGNGQAYAEYVASPASHLALKPVNVSHEQAAASSMVATTAYQALVDVAQIKRGDRVVIHGASGGVGHLAVQIAKHFGAYVIGISSGKNRDFVLSLGADEHVDYTAENFKTTLKDIDIVLDTIQGATLLDSVDVVRSKGMIVTLPSPEIPAEVKTKADEKQVYVEFMMVASKQETILAIAQLLEAEILKPHIDKAFAFDEIGLAHRALETNHVVGKVVVNV